MQVGFNDPQKSIKVARINYISHEASKTYFCTLRWWIDVLRVQSRENNSENLTRFRGGFKTENFKKIRKN